MKNSKEYAKKVRKLYNSLRRKYSKVENVVYDEPVDALVYAIVSMKMSEAASESAIRRFHDYFIDLNDLRVSRAEEVIEVLGSDTPDNRVVASSLTVALRSVFEKYGTVSLKALKKTGKRPAKQILEKMNGVSPFVVDYCMLTSLQGHAIPLTRKMIDYLRNNELVDADADEQQIGGFLAKQISAERAYEFYVYLRRQSESRRAGAKTKAAHRTKTRVATGTEKAAKETTRTKRRKK